MESKVKCVNIYSFLNDPNLFLRNYPELRNVKKVIIKGPPGIGKSTTISKFNEMYYKEGKKFTAIDCEQVTKGMRVNIVRDSTYGLFGSADLTPNNYPYKDVVWVYLTMDPKLLKERRETRDANDPYKKDQRFFNTLQITDGYAYINGSINIIFILDVSHTPEHSCKCLHSFLSILYKQHDVKELEIPFNIKQYIKNTNYTSKRIVKMDNGYTYEDCTPFNMLASLTFQVPDLPFDCESEAADIITNKGELTPFHPYFNTLTNFYKERYMKNFPYSTVLSRFFMKPIKSQLFSVGLVLPTSGIYYNGKANLNDFEILTQGTEQWNEFMKAFVPVLIEESKRSGLWNETTLEQVGKLFTRYDIATESTQNIMYSSKHKIQVNEFEREAIKYWGEKHYQFNKLCLDCMSAMLRIKPEDLCPSIKPFNSPGSRLVDENGFVYNASNHLECLHEALSSDNPKKNAYYKRSFRELKKYLLTTISDCISYRFNMANEFKLFDFVAESIAFNLMFSRTQIRALRKNGPDNVNVENEKGIRNIVFNYERTIKQEPLTEQAIYDALAECKTVLLQGKDRVCSHYVNQGYITYKVPKIMYSVTLEKKRLEWLENNLNYLNDSKLCYTWYAIANHSLLGPVLRVRGIFPSDWCFNMFDLVVAKACSIGISECLIGFPTLNPNEKKYKFINNEVTSYEVAVASHDDSTNNETLITSNPFFIIGGIPYDSPEWALLTDCCCGWILTENGPQFHGRQTSSGIGFTSKHNEDKSILTSSLDIAYRAQPEERLSLFKKTIDFIYAHVCSWYLERYGLEQFKLMIPDSFQLDDFPQYTLKNGKKCKVIHLNGTDDNIYFDVSNEASSDEIFENLHNKDLDDFRSRWFINHDDGAGSYFGVDIGSNGYTKTEVTSLGKFFSHEHVKIGDFIAMKYVTAFKNFPPLKKAVQAGLDAINAGNVDFYELASNWANTLMHQLNVDLTDYLESFDLGYNPNADAIKQQLGDLVHSDDISNKIPVHIIQQWIDAIDEFRKNYKYDYQNDPYLKYYKLFDLF